MDRHHQPTAPPQNLLQGTPPTTPQMCNFTPPPPSYSSCTIPSTPPPSPEEKSPPTPPTDSKFPTFPTTPTSIHTLLTSHFSTTPPPAPLSSLSITSISQNNAYTYKINALTEKRTLHETSSPFSSQEIDSYPRIPKKWDVPIQPPISLVNYPIFHYKNFTSSQKTPLPHSDRVVDCVGCRRSGSLNCRRCSGSGFTRCPTCSGTSFIISIWSSAQKPCPHCTTGQIPCPHCYKGSTHCPTCSGYGRLKISRVIHSKWDLRSWEEFTERGALTGPFLGDAKGWVRVEKISLGPVHAPLVWRGDEEISRMAAERLLEVVKRQGVDCRVLEVRHGIEEVPVVKVDYTWEINGILETGHFFIYSRDCRVYFPKMMRDKDRDGCVIS